MMKRFEMKCVLAVLIVSLTGRTQAGFVTTYVDVVDATVGQPGTYFVPSGTPDAAIQVPKFGNPHNRFYNQDWGWTHTFSPSAFAPGQIYAATLQVTAYDVDPGEIDVISGDGLALGPLVGGAESWSTTVFNLSGPALDRLLDGTVDISVDIDSTNPFPHVLAWSANLGSSTLTVEAIPAPGAILLGTIGVGMVSWLRRRRTL